MQYRKRPVVVDAWHFTDANKDRVYHDVREHCLGVIPTFDNGKPVLRIPTLEGEMTASLDDWIIRGVKGELYPVKDEIFRETYESVDATTEEKAG